MNWKREETKRKPAADVLSNRKPQHWARTRKIKSECRNIM